MPTIGRGSRSARPGSTGASRQVPHPYLDPYRYQYNTSSQPQCRTPADRRRPRWPIAPAKIHTRLDHLQAPYNRPENQRTGPSQSRQQRPFSPRELVQNSANTTRFSHSQAQLHSTPGSLRQAAGSRQIRRSRAMLNAVGRANPATRASPKHVCKPPHCSREAVIRPTNQRRSGSQTIGIPTPRATAPWHAERCHRRMNCPRTLDAPSPAAQKHRFHCIPAAAGRTTNMTERPAIQDSAHPRSATRPRGPKGNTPVTQQALRRPPDAAPPTPILTLMTRINRIQDRSGTGPQRPRNPRDQPHEAPICVPTCAPADRNAAQRLHPATDTCAEYRKRDRSARTRRPAASCALHPPPRARTSDFTQARRGTSTARGQTMVR